MVMVPLVLHAAACWEKDWGVGEAEALREDRCVLRQQVKVHRGRAHYCSCCCSGSHWGGGWAGCPVRPPGGPGASPPAGPGECLRPLLPGW